MSGIKGSAIYQINNLTQSYQNRTVLQVEQLEVWQGEILALVGPAGRAKVPCCVT
jgi:ABC-type lipopolysaccharide export system ATPase subunit